MQFAKKQARKRLEFNPVIVCPLNSDGVPMKFYVMINHFYLKDESFKHAVDLFLKSYYVFDASFPAEGTNFCKFLQEMFYNIGSDDTVTYNFIKDLKAEKSKLDIEN